MNRRNFLKSATVAAVGIPTVGMCLTNEEQVKEPVYDRMKLSHQYPGAYHEPNDLFTPEEITDSGFVFVPYPSCIHNFTDPQNPIMASYVGYGNNLDPTDKNYLPIVMRSRMCTPMYIKTYDWDRGRKRGIESLPDYFRKKDTFKPMILDFMRRNEYHYVYRILLGDSPCFWRQKMGRDERESDFYLYPVFIRGCKLPKKA